MKFLLTGFLLVTFITIVVVHFRLVRSGNRWFRFFEMLVLVTVILGAVTGSCSYWFAHEYKNTLARHHVVIDNTEAYYFAAQTITTVGYGELTGLNVEIVGKDALKEIRRFSTQAMYIGAFSWAVLISSVVALFLEALKVLQR